MGDMYVNHGFGKEPNEGFFVYVSDEDLFSAEKLGAKVKEVLGEERMFSGNMRINSFTSNLEMTANGVEEVNFESLVKELEAKV